MHRRYLTIAVMVMMGAASPALADATVGSLDISSPWARATPPGAPTGGGYLTIANHGTTPDVLLGASTPDAASTELHSMAVVNGVAQMRAVPDGVPIPADGTVTFDPSGLHFMFVQLAHPLTQGATILVTLKFKNAGTVAVEMPILGIGSPGPSGNAAPGSGATGGN